LKSLVRLAALGAALVICGAASAQQYPTKPVKIIIPFAAGGVTDIAGRVIAAELSKRMGQQFYIENVAGAGGNIGMGRAARAAADGYTVLLASSSYVVNPNLYASPPYDANKDFIPVLKAGFTPNAWMVNPSFPAKSMQELVALFKKEPGKHSVGSPGTGTTPSLSIEMLKHDLKLDYVTVPFKGGGPSTQAALAGHVPVTCGALGNAVSILKDGKLRALAVAAKKRSAAMPDVPTLEEVGIKNQEAETMQGVFVPTGTPKAIVDRLQKEISAVVNTPEIKARLLSLGIEADGGSQADFEKYVKDEIAKWKRVMEAANIKKI
jgi:tripartite-type tricarboxylate transporter receptor subunit TctC